MDWSSERTLRYIRQNDTTDELLLGDCLDFITRDGVDKFSSTDARDYSTLGTYIGENTYMTRLKVAVENLLPLEDGALLNGLKQNSSISELTINCGRFSQGSTTCHSIIGGLGHEILQIYHEKNQLTNLNIDHATMENGGDRLIVSILEQCSNLKSIVLFHCGISDEHLLPIVETVRGHDSLEKLYLMCNNVGDVGSQAIATLLEESNCNLQEINLTANQIGSQGASTLIATLSNNTKLKTLLIHSNPMGETVHDFPMLLCNTSSINHTYLSNHTLQELYVEDREKQLAPLLQLNKGIDKSYVAIKKILRSHPNIDMEPLFELDMEEGERSLKALPYVIAWFEKAAEAVASDNGVVAWFSSDEDNFSYDVEERKLSAIYQFARAMPLLFVPASHVKGDDKKRNRR